MPLFYHYVIYRDFKSTINGTFQQKKFDIFLIFAQNTDCGYTLEAVYLTAMRTDAVLTSTHNVCFGAKIRKIGIPLHTPVLLYISGV